MKQIFRVLIFALAVSGLAVAQDTPTPTSTPTNTPTNTPTAVSYTPVPIATGTPLARSLSILSPQSALVRGDLVLEGDVVIRGDETGGNAGAARQFIGSLKQAGAVTGTMTNGSTESGVAYIDDSPAGEWAGLASDVVASTNSSVYRVGSASLKLAFSAAATTWSGAEIDITNDDLTVKESLGFWIYVSETTSTGDLVVRIKDTLTPIDFQIPGIGTPRKWHWIELDITPLATTSGDVTDKIQVLLTSQGASNHGAFDVYLDAMRPWDSADEETLGFSLAPDSTVVCFSIATAAGTANTPALMAEHTDYIINYQTGNDVIVSIADNSALSGWCYGQAE